MEERKIHDMMYHVVNLTVDLFDWLKENEDYGCYSGDDAMELIIKLAKEFEANYNDRRMYTEQLEDFENKVRNKKSELLKAMPKCDIWLDEPVEIGGNEINRVYVNPELDESYVEYINGDYSDLWFLDEMTVFDIEKVLELITWNVG